MQVVRLKFNVPNNQIRYFYSMKISRIGLVLLFICFLSQRTSAQAKIEGHLILDTAIWSPIAYLSLIPDFGQMNTMTVEMIIDQTPINKSGYFNFNTQFLPKEDQLYRIHISKKNDPCASLSIGGKDENHLFFVANRENGIFIRDTSIIDFIKSSVIEGHPANRGFQEINQILSYIDSISFNGSQMRKDLIRNAIDEKLRYYADTCTIPIVALYALNKSQFSKNYPINQSYYERFNKKWKNEKSVYFAEFRNKTQYKTNRKFLFYVLLCSSFFIIGYYVNSRFRKHEEIEKYTIKDLTNQERKILLLIKEGKSNKEISEGLAIGLSTVKSHVYSIYSKLNIRSRKEILNLDFNNGSVLD